MNFNCFHASDGAGVKLKRSIGTPEADYIDPFLMLDEFGSENKDDYIAGGNVEGILMSLPPIAKWK